MKRVLSRGVLLALLTGSAVVAVNCPGKRGMPADEGAAMETVRSYIRAIERHDGEAVCSLLARGVRERIDEAIRARRPELSCPEVVTHYIGYVEDSGTPKWRHVHLEDGMRVVVRGASARASYYVTHQFEEYESELLREVIEPARKADVVELAKEGGAWRLRSTGRVLSSAGAGTPFTRVGRGSTSGTPRKAIEELARDYVLGLSGAPIEPCTRVPWLESEQECLDRSGIRADPTERPVWQAARLRGLRIQMVDRRRARVSLDLSETYLTAHEGRYRLFDRPLRDELRLSRAAKGWQLDTAGLLFYHSRYASPPSGPAPGRPRGVPLVYHGAGRRPILTQGSRTGFAFWFERTPGHTTELRARVIAGTTPRGASRVITRVPLPRRLGVGSVLHGLVAAQDRRRGNALVAWLSSRRGSSRHQVHAVAVDAGGRRIGPIRQAGASPCSADRSGR